MTTYQPDEQGRRWRRRPTSPGISLIRLILFALVLQAPALYLIWNQGHNVDTTTKNTNDVVQFIKEQTDPERQAQQQELLNGILIRIDCNDARRLQSVIDGLVEQRLIEPFDVRTNCG